MLSTVLALLNCNGRQLKEVLTMGLELFVGGHPQRLAAEVPPGLPKRRRTDLGPGFR